MRIACPCGIQLLLEDEHTEVLGPCPRCGRPLDVELHRSASLLGSLSVDAEKPALIPAALEPSAARPPLEPTAPPTESVDPLASLAVPDDTEPRRPLLRLYSPNTVAAAALLGGGLAGCLLLASNYRRLRRKGAARLTVLVGVLATLAILAAVWEYADVPPRLGAVRYLGCLFLAELVGAGLLLLPAVRILQGRAFLAHRLAGGKCVPGRSVVGACLFCAALVFGLQILISYPLTWRGSGSGMVFGENEELYFTEGVTREQATRLGRKLQEIGLLNNRGSKTVVVEKEGEDFQVRFFLSDSALLRLGIREDFEELRDLLSKEVFDGRRVRILLCDRANRVVFTIQ